ncbi:hypothetical protein PX860_26195 (plasmid) [Agrobacterium leguminum]|uniref:hypothetical protein n=1 Tax=Agrobacterium leguminum TaxID=2792015 RepID=UPI00272CA7BD|nr:hypothetical protein [Agrobacterium leguminum]WLE00395.1 hypothetical protein PX860_26195 [Agrobacterium leguminum]
MLVVETISKIRRLAHVQGKSIKAICRELGISRKVVRKVLRTDETEFKYERVHQPQPKLGPWREQLDGMLLANEAKPSRERLTLIRIFEDLRDLGYEGGYDTVRRYARVWAKERGAITAEAYVPLYYAPGEAYQFDWSHEIVVLGGVTTTVKVAHVRLCNSRMMYVRAYADRIVIRQNGVEIGQHERHFGRGETIYNPWHYVPVLARKPGALRNGAPFHDWVLPVAMEKVRRKLKAMHDGDRQMVSILECVGIDGLPVVEAACQEALDQGVFSASVIINILARKRDPLPVAILSIPDALRLTLEPLADCARYDSLRRAS